MNRDSIIDDLEIEYLERLLSDMENSIAAQRINIDTYDNGTAAVDYIAEINDEVIARLVGMILVDDCLDSF